MPSMCDAFFQSQLHQFLCWRTHVLVALSKRNNGKPIIYIMRSSLMVA
jgi:hypothetical protein